MSVSSDQFAGTVSWSAHGWGAEIYPQITGLEPGQEYELVAVGKDGNVDVVMTWFGAEGMVNPIGTMSIMEANLDRMFVRRTGTTEELLWFDATPPGEPTTPPATPSPPAVAAAS
jgi:hypothetical protein